MSLDDKTNKLKKYWKSFKDLSNDPEMLEREAREFMDGEDKPFEIDKMSGVSRRKFMALLAASASFTAASCTNYRDKKEVIPYNNRPVGVNPGFANYYASTCSGCVNACGTLVKTREGRPIKVDGNPEHPVNKGKLCVKGQSSIMDLYNPVRFQYPMKSGSKTSWETADKEIDSLLNAAISSNKEIAIIANKINSPTSLKVIESFKNRFSTANIYTYDLFNDSNKISAWEKSYGSKSIPTISFDKAKVVVSLEGDFLGNDGNHVENAGLFSKTRDVVNNKKGFSRLYSFEAAMSITGMKADYRQRIRPDAQYDLIMALAHQILHDGKSKINVSSGTKKILEKYSLNEVIEKHKISGEVLKSLVEDLESNQGHSIIYAGSSLTEATHLAVNLLNEMVGADKLFRNNAKNVSVLEYSTPNDWENLINKMNSGNVDVVIHLDSNPVYHMPKDLGYEEALKKVANVISLSENENESVAKSKYVLPINNQLESWGDYNNRSGIISLQQPVIHSLYETRQKEAILLNWSQNSDYKDNVYHAFLKENWKKDLYKKVNTATDFDRFWNSALHDGVVTYKETEENNSFNIDSVIDNDVKHTNKFLVMLTDDYHLGDGKFSSNGWLQEIPHPVTKIVWDNYASISNNTAKSLDVDNDDLIKVTIGNRSLDLPVHIQPSMVDNVVAVASGYGRKNSGIIADGVGFNANELLSKSSSVSPWVYNDANVSKTDGKYELVSTQEHLPLESKTFLDSLIKDIQVKRHVIQEINFEDYKNHKTHLHTHEPRNTTKPHKYLGNKWGMTIDLNKCTACTACVASCNVENNIAVVGKDQVKVNREMHWIRIDRYYSGTPEDATVSLMPMLCQHCDNAPCEYVCPVNATNHSPDGLNQMAYQRCVGTRYCLNNCPYKVRRFNFFNFRNDFAKGYYKNESLKLIHNPEVTVRSRGVMEKCSFCVQRIMEERQEAIKENRKVNGNNVTVACQDACPTNAIVFGDTNDPNSEVAQTSKHDTGYHVLEEINTKPAVTYMARVFNTHSDGNGHGNGHEKKSHSEKNDHSEKKEHAESGSHEKSGH